MKHFLVIAVTNDEGFFIFDTYNQYIVRANSEKDAEFQLIHIPHFKDMDSISEIKEDSARALIKVNRTKTINSQITQLILL